MSKSNQAREVLSPYQQHSPWCDIPKRRGECERDGWFILDVLEYAYDVMDCVANIAWKTTGGATLGGIAYRYDAVGRIVSRDHSLGDSSQMSQSSQKNYSYDSLDRLSSDGGVSYTCDAAGNRMTKTEDGETITYTLGVGDRLASWTGGAYSYNAAGCVTRIERDGKPTLDLTWDSQYQLVSVSTNGVFAEGYEYDAIGRRVSTTTAEGRTRHVYDSNWQVIADVDENDNVLVSYTWGAGIDNLLAVNVGGATYYPITDIQGTVWGYVDSQNNVVARWQYDAWGNVIDESVSVPVLASIRYRFQGREWSAATGLINFRMRWYDSETGRWLSKDPIGLHGGINLYCFCRNAPVLLRDPDGLIPLPLLGGLTGAAVGGIAGGFGGLLSGKGFWRGAIVGAIGGAIAGATMGAVTPLLETAAGISTGMGAGVGAVLGSGSGAVGGLASGLSDELSSDECFSWKNVGTATAAGAVGGAVGGAFGGAFGPALTKVESVAVDFTTTAWGTAGVEIALH